MKDSKKCNLPENLVQDKSEWRDIFHVAATIQLGQVFDDDDSIINLMAPNTYVNI